MSEQGRRVLIAPIEGAAGDRIQAWRLAHDHAQARRYPPHVTLCYEPPRDDSPAAREALARQVRHAFSSAITIRLGGVHRFAGGTETLYVEVLSHEALDAARERLFDGAHTPFPTLRPWPWHVSCLRNATTASPDLVAAARAALALDEPYAIAAVEYRELRGEVYEVLERWDLPRD